MELEGARVPVTGGSRGNDACLARAQAAPGAQVVVARSGDDLRAAADEVGGAAHVADLSDPEVVDGLVAVIEDPHAPTTYPSTTPALPPSTRLIDACSTPALRVFGQLAKTTEHLCRIATDRRDVE